MVAWLVRPSLQPTRALADVSPSRGVQRSLPTSHRALRKAAMEPARRRNRRGGRKAVLPPDAFQAGRAQTAQGARRRTALGPSRHALARNGALAPPRA